MYIITENHAGGSRIKHRTIEAAAARIAGGSDGVYMGYRIADADSEETQQAVLDRVEEIREMLL